MRKFVIPEIFFQKIAEKGKLYSRIWFYWLGSFVDELFDEGFLEKQQEELNKWKLPESEIREIYNFGVQHLQQDFVIEEKKKKKKVVPKELQEVAESIIDYLNETAEKKFSKNSSNLELIYTKFKEGYGFEDFKFVIDQKVTDWKGTDFEQYLRPITLFAKQFENYINQKNAKRTTNFDKFAISVTKAQSISFRGEQRGT